MEQKVLSWNAEKSEHSLLSFCNKALKDGWEIQSITPTITQEIEKCQIVMGAFLLLKKSHEHGK